MKQTPHPRRHRRSDIKPSCLVCICFVFGANLFVVFSNLRISKQGDERFGQNIALSFITVPTRCHTVSYCQALKALKSLWHQPTSHLSPHNNEAVKQRWNRINRSEKSIIECGRLILKWHLKVWNSSRSCRWRGGDSVAEQKLASFAQAGRPKPLTPAPLLLVSSHCVGKELNKIGHITKNNHTGCVCVPAAIYRLPALVVYPLRSARSLYHKWSGKAIKLVCFYFNLQVLS